MSLQGRTHRGRCRYWTFIVRSPDIPVGKPRIAGTDVTVQRIVGWYKLGLDPKETIMLQKLTDQLPS